MNENVLSFIKWAAGIVITLAIISIAFIVFNTSKDATMRSIKQLGEMNAQIAESNLTMYDDLEISGSEVINVIRKYQDDYLGIQVITGNDPGGTWYGYNVTISGSTGTIGSEASSDLRDAIDTTSSQYVNPNGEFLGKVYRDANGMIVGLVFDQQ